MIPFLARFSLGFLLVFMSFFLIALVLIQRGRGGGLAGAFGGAGGQSAFGTKAGDVFTRITVLVASCWILLCILAINVLGTTSSRIAPTLGGAAGQRVTSEVETPAAPESKPADAETKPAPEDVDAKSDAEAPKADAPTKETPSDPEPPTETVSEPSSPEPTSPAAE